MKVEIPLNIGIEEAIKSAWRFAQIDTLRRTASMIEARCLELEKLSETDTPQNELGALATVLREQAYSIENRPPIIPPTAADPSSPSPPAPSSAS